MCITLTSSDSKKKPRSRTKRNSVLDILAASYGSARNEFDTAEACDCDNGMPFASRSKVSDMSADTSGAADPTSSRLLDGSRI